MTIAIEGNIGAGKSSLLANLKSDETVQIIKYPEPLEKWTNLQGVNLLERMYTDPGEWILPFQLYAMLTLAENHQAENPPSVVKIMERSIFSCIFCFLKANYIMGRIDQTKCEVLKQWFEFVSNRIKMDLDLIIYIRTSPDILMNRIRARNRIEERGIQPDFINLLHRCHEEWLIERNDPRPAEVIVINGDNSQEQMLAELEIKLRFFRAEREEWSRIFD